MNNLQTLSNGSGYSDMCRINLSIGHSPTVLHLKESQPWLVKEAIMYVKQNDLRHFIESYYCDSWMGFIVSCEILVSAYAWVDPLPDSVRAVLRIEIFSLQSFFGASDSAT